MRAGRMLIFARVSVGRAGDDVIRTTRVNEAMHARVYTFTALSIDASAGGRPHAGPVIFHFSENMNWPTRRKGGSVAEWLACRTRAQKARVQIAAATLSGNSLRQAAHTHCASVHQAAKLVATLLRIALVTAGLAESNGSLPPGL